MTFNEISNIFPFKTNIFIDWLNVKANGGRQLDYFKLTDVIRDKGGIILRANIYLPRPDNEKVRNFHSVMQRAGLRLIYVEKTWARVNCDALMAVDMVTQSRDVDAIFLLSNDSDFVPAVEYLQSIGKRVLLIHGDNPSNDLRRAVDEWRHFEQLNLIRNNEFNSDKNK